MLVVISDLHFEEESYDNIPGDEIHPAIAYSRNLPSRVYRSFVSHLAEEAARNGATRMDLAFAGDIFDIHRTSMWTRSNPAAIRPYVTLNQVDNQTEQMVLRILAAIDAEKEVRKSLAVFQMLANGKYWNQGERDFPVPVAIHYIPGNHDRLANATPATRQAVRDALGIPASGEPFPHTQIFEAERTAIRHGHEYDRYNFGMDISEVDEIPLRLPDEAYDQSPFGDFVTVDIAARLPQMFRSEYRDEKIRSDRVLRTIYQRLLEFDDFRPQSAMLNFLLHMPERYVEADKVWRILEPILYRLLEELHADHFLHFWLDKMDKKWRLDAIDVVQTVLALKAWRLPGGGIPMGLAQFISNTVIASQRDAPGAEQSAAREQVIRSGQCRFLVAGHTHKPAVALLASDARGQRYYIDTGTWRNRIPSTSDFTAFGRLKSLTYVVIYGPDEDTAEALVGPKVASVDFWSGITQRWYSEYLG